MTGTTVNIPLTTLAAGTHDVGPAAVSDADSLITITIDRTVANGLNAVGAAVSVRLAPSQSDDGGATWIELAAATATGGVQPKGATTSVIEVGLWPGTGRQVKAAVTVTGGAVAVQGTLATQ